MPKVPTGMCKLVFHLCCVHKHMVTAPFSQSQQHLQAQLMGSSHTWGSWSVTVTLKCGTQVPPHSLCPSMSHEPDAARLCQGDNFRNVSGHDQPATSWGRHSTQCQSPSHGKLCMDLVWKREDVWSIWLRDITVRKKGFSALAKLVNAWKVILPQEKTWQRCNAGLSIWYDYGEPQSSQAQRKTIILTGH